MTMISTTMGKNSLEEMEKSESEVAQLCPTLCDPMDCSLLHPWDFPGKNTGVDCHFLLQEIFLTQESNPGLLHCRQVLYHLSYRGSLPGWAVPLFPVRPSKDLAQTRKGSHLAGGRVTDARVIHSSSPMMSVYRSGTASPQPQL